MNKKNQAGFTLMELVITTVVIGILASVAIPKYINLASSARISSVRALEGALKGAAESAHQYIVTASASGIIDVRPGVLVISQQNINKVGDSVSVYCSNYSEPQTCYPAANADGIITSLQTLDNTQYYTDIQAGESLGRGIVTISKTGVASNCSVTYDFSTKTTPIITADIGGC